MAISRVALPTRLQGAAIDYIDEEEWRVWLHTPNHIHGTYLTLFSDGRVHRVTVREDEGDEVVVIKP